MNAVLLEKQQELLSRVKEQPLELPSPLPQPNARKFPTSQKRRMTAYEAAIQEERDAVVRRRRQHIRTQEDEDSRQAYREEAVARIVERHSQVGQPPPSSPSPASTSPPPSSSSSSSNSDGDSDFPHDS